MIVRTASINMALTAVIAAVTATPSRAQEFHVDIDRPNEAKFVAETNLADIEGTTPEEMSRAYFAGGEGRTSLLQRWAQPEEIAAVVAFLCSPLASAVNGSAPRADGGMIRSLF